MDGLFLSAPGDSKNLDSSYAGSGKYDAGLTAEQLNVVKANQDNLKKAVAERRASTGETGRMTASPNRTSSKTSAGKGPSVSDQMRTQATKRLTSIGELKKLEK